MTEQPGWHAVALAGGVGTGTSTGTRLFGEEIVVWRDANGAAHAWEDRCPHRGMRLSMGFVRADRIACLYHGWQYGTDGHCLYIPAHPEINVPPSIVTWRHSCAEALGMIWVYFGDATDQYRFAEVWRNVFGRTPRFGPLPAQPDRWWSDRKR